MGYANKGRFELRQELNTKKERGYHQNGKILPILEDFK
jgi:hypothetical protein